MQGKKSRKQEILDAALQCFVENGIEATTIEMIRERSGASVGSLYHHFGSKESIALALYGDALAGHAELQRRLLTAARSAEEGVKGIAGAYVDWVAANPDKARFVLYSRSALARSEAADALAQGGKAHIAEVMRWFQPHIDSGALKRLPPECYASLIVGPAHDYARLWLSGRTRTPLAALRAVFVEAAWNALKP